MSCNKLRTPKPIDGTQFLEMLSTISLEEVLLFEFRRKTTDKWEIMVVCPDPLKKMYRCNVCNVVQYGDKNLFGHLCGKKHNLLMISVKQFQMRNRITTPLNLNSSKSLKTANVESSSGANNKFMNQTNVTKTTTTSPKMANSKLKPQSVKSKLPGPNGEVMKNTTSGSKNCTNARGIQCENKLRSNSSHELKSKTSLINNDNNNKNNNSGTIVDLSKKNVTKSTPPASLKSTIICDMSKHDIKKESSAPKSVSKSISEKIPPSQTIAQVEPCPEPTPMVQNMKESQVEVSQNIPNIPSIVKNPLATKISCVPLAKLLGSAQSKERKKSNSDVIIINEEEPNQNKEEKLHKVISHVQNTNESYSNVDRIANKKIVDKINEVVPVIDIASRFKESNTSSSGLSSFTFDSKKTPKKIVGLVGVEYVIKVVRNISDKNARYQCSLCEITSWEATMHTHLLGYNHRLKYFEKHFPTAMRQYRQYVSEVPESDVCKVMIPILDKLAMAVEKHHGRETAFLCYESFYKTNRAAVVEKVYKKRHFSEQNGPTFTHVVDSKDVEKLLENARNKSNQTLNVGNSNATLCESQNINVPQTANYETNAYFNYPQFAEAPCTETVDDETHKRLVENFLKGTRKSLGSSKPKSRNMKRTRSRSHSSDRWKKVPSPELKRQYNTERRSLSLSPLRDGDIWQAYRHMVDQKVRELNVSFEVYKSDPEQHPLYQEEWQTFWKRRKDELILLGINHRSYNFQNEWIIFFNARLEELYNRDMENIKLKCRERLCLPMTNDKLMNSNYHVHAPEKMNMNTETMGASRSSLDNLTDDDTTKIIHVLRLLTALEEFLGSLGPSITEMLTKALQTQKTDPDNVQNLLLTSENCAKLETAKEKFKGILISKIYDPVKERAITKAIIDTEALLKNVDKSRGYINSSSKNNSNSVHKITEKKDNQMACKDQYNVQAPIDKRELAAKLASSLISQGKTSINRDELQKILHVYSLIEKKKRQDELETLDTGRIENTAQPLQPDNSIYNSCHDDNELTRHSIQNCNIGHDGNSMYTGGNSFANAAHLNNTNSNPPNPTNEISFRHGFDLDGYQYNRFDSAALTRNQSSNGGQNSMNCSSFFPSNQNQRNSRQF
ncbi:uncharacterized protein LOC117585666 [Drosophila guanche]|uniref:Blast:Uncharacterized protein CG7065 n=1 Tax=Drosophila guanche TaxID=7266 RepID=A0A3B0JLX3_DROGU|nr:uncharacterized protein LOC117585666 [Drosophila guanche]SPP83235.1 blast:Uncharacterized protein CG7065 [Drosophila guanche]